MPLWGLGWGRTRVGAKPYWISARVCCDTGWRKSFAKVKSSGAVDKLVVQSRAFSFSKSGWALPVIFSDV